MFYWKECVRIQEKAVLFVLFLSALIVGVFTRNSSQGITVRNLPPGTPLHLSRMLRHKTISREDKCPDAYLSDIMLLLYTRNSKSPVHLNPTNPTQLNPSKALILVMHGWLLDANSFGLPELKDAYLKRYDCSVINVDWSGLAWQTYGKSACCLPKIARLLADFLCLIHRNFKIPVNTVHLVGHSMGAQMAGFVGQDTLAKCGQEVGRITGLDAAGHLFQDVPLALRLDKEDAMFVDVIHTNDLILGYVGNCGDVDFYVNCGTLQPGCPGINPGDFLDHPLAVMFCDHFRSVEYLTESVNSDRFKARACSHYPMPTCTPDSQESPAISMGEDCPKTASGGYILNTNSESPYAMG